MNELKPCPFCGGEKIVLISCFDEACVRCMEECENCQERVYAYCCSTQQKGCGASSGYFKLKEEALKRWNRRNKND